MLGALQNVSRGGWPRWDSKSSTAIGVDFVRAAAVLPSAEAFELQERLLRELPRLTNTWTTAEYYSRSHLVLPEDLLLAFLAVRRV